MKNVRMNILKKSAVALTVALVVMISFVNQVAAQGKSVAASSNPVISLAKGPKVVAPKTIDAAVFQVENTLKFKVHLENYAGKDVYIKIKNAAKKVVYQEKIKNASKYIRKFDFSTMEDGEYTFEISNGTETLTKDISLQTLSARSLQIND